MPPIAWLKLTCELSMITSAGGIAGGGGALDLEDLEVVETMGMANWLLAT